MIEAVIAGEQGPQRLADLAQRALRKKSCNLALSGKVRDHHRILLRVYISESFLPFKLSEVRSATFSALITP